MPLDEANNSNLFSRLRGFSLLGSFFDDERRKSAVCTPVQSDCDIPLDDLRRRLIDDDSWSIEDDDTPPLTPAVSQNSIGKQPEQPERPITTNAEEEWYGLEYTLEMSTRERRASETHSEISAGEFSKSRESWAALQPVYADERSFMEWQDWHTYLDYKKVYDFLESSRNHANAYVQEIWNWDSFYWELSIVKHHYGSVDRPLKQRLRNAPRDPYYPRRKKNFAWYLKRSRSVASMRELAPPQFP